MHDIHERLPGYDPGNVLHDGCGECEGRAVDPLDGLTALDHLNFRQAWADMLAAKWSGGEGLTRNVSACDWRLLSALYTIAVLLERHALIDPRGLAVIIERHCEQLDAEEAAMFGERS